MDVETRMQLALKMPTQEIVKEDELRELFETKAHPTHYLGLEISGLLHLGSLFFNGLKFNDLIKAGVKCHVYLADWHSVINNKLGGDWEKIQKASEYYEEAFKFFCPGINIVKGSDLYRNNDEYWKNVVDFSRHVTLSRATRCLAIMGRSENDALSVSQYLYPSMQAVDIKALGADIAHAGMDQRKVHMLAREIYPKMGWKVPISLHHYLLSGLLEPEKTQGQGKACKVTASKMSKSKPGTAIFIHDSSEEIKKKLNKAFCPAKVIEANPVLEVAKHLILRGEKSILKVERPDKFGGNVDYCYYSDLEKDFAEGKLHPTDLKNSVAVALDVLIGPVRSHFEKKKELLKVYEQVEVTR